MANEKLKIKRPLLVIDDDDGLRDLIAKTLCKFGYEIICSANGSDAIKHIVGDQPAALLIDQKLPDMTGQQIIEVVAGLGKKVPFIVMTGQGDERLAVEMMKLGASDYLVKDMDFLDILPLAVDRLFDTIRAEEALQKTEEQYRIINNASIDFIYSFDLSGRFTTANRSLCEAMGVTSDRIIGRTHGELGFPQIQCREWEELIKRVYSENGVVVSEMFTPMPDGAMLIYEVALNPIHGPDGMTTGISGVSRDITDHKQAEEALKESEEKHRVLVEAAAEAIFIVQDDMIRFCNKSFSDVTGFKLEEFANRPFSDLIHPDDRQMVFDRYIQRMEGKDVTSRYAFRFIDASGNTRWADLNVSIILWNGKPATLCLATDITERKLADEKLRESETLQRTLLESLPVGIVVIDPVTKIIENVNKSAEAMFGIQAEHIKGHRCHSFLCPACEGACPVYDFGKEIDNAEREMLCSDGSLRPILKSVIRIQMRGQEKLLECFVDISVQKQAETALKESEIKLRQVIDLVPHFIFAKDVDGKFILANKAVAEIYETNIENLIGKSDFDFNQNTEEVRNFIEDDKKVIESGSGLFGIQEVITDSNGNKKYLETTKIPFAASGTKKPALLGISVDITERKLAEQALRESEERFSMAIAGTGAGLWDWDMVKNTVFFSSQWKIMLGYEDHEVENDFSGWKNLWHPEDAARIEKAVKDYLDGKTKNYEIEHRLRHKDGTWHWILTRGDIHYDSDGKPARWIGTNIDITESRRAEEALRESEERYRTLIDTSPDPIIMYDLSGKILSVNPEAVRVYGVASVDEFLSEVKSIFDVLTKDGKTFASTNFRRTLKEEVSQKNEYVLQKHDKSIITIEVNSSVVKSATGEPAAFISVIRDITERKRAEEAIRESEKRASMQRTAISELVLDRIFAEGKTSLALKRIIEVLSSTIGVARTSVWTVSKDSSELQCLSLYESDKMIHSNGETLKVADFPRYFEAIMSENRIYVEDAQNDPRTSELTEPYLKTLGITSMLDAGIFIEGRLAGVVCCEHIGTIRQWHPDEESFISTAAAIVAQLFLNAERKRAEEALKESETRFRDLAELLPQIIFETDRDGLLTYTNRIAFDKFSYKYEDLKKGLNVLQMIDQNDREQAIKNFSDMVNGIRIAPAAEYLALRKDGSTFPVSIFAAPVVENNNIIGLRGIIVDITERKQMEIALRESQQTLDSILRNLPDIVYRLDPEGRITYINDAVRKYGYDPAEMIDNSMLDYVYAPDKKEAVYRLNERRTGDRKTTAFEIRLLPRNIQVKHFEIKSDVVRELPVLVVDAEGLYVSDKPSKDIFLGTQGVARDITERKHMEEERERLQNQLTQAQKMETVGRLAGGVAHDFNNMLNVILGYSAILQSEIEHDHPYVAYLEEIQNAAKRSADLTRQLLAFARKQTVAPKVLDINETVAGMLKMLQRLIGEDIELTWKPGQDPWPIKVDPSQVDQILANLCVNARDAISGVGNVIIETDNAAFDEAYCVLHEGFLQGEYVLLAVSDNGCGMDAEILSHLFEPFFTTKETGKGTGLGLATVYGAVKQNNGFVNVYSEPGFGTTFKIYLPRHLVKVSHKTEELKLETSARGSETILLVEDEQAILKMTTMMLEKMGYSVLAASTPGEAIRLAKEHPGCIDLLITDVVMPEMNGRELAKNLLSIYPDIRRLFMSGYTADVIAHHGVLDEGVHFIQKPFSVNDLTAKLREALEIIEN